MSRQAGETQDPFDFVTGAHSPPAEANAPSNLHDESADDQEQQQQQQAPFAFASAFSQSSRGATEAGHSADPSFPFHSFATGQQHHDHQLGAGNNPYDLPVSLPDASSTTAAAIRATTGFPIDASLIETPTAPTSKQRMPPTTASQSGFDRHGPNTAEPLALASSLIARLDSDKLLYQRAYRALNDELIKAQIEQSVLRNVKTIAESERNLIRHSGRPS